MSLTIKDFIQMGKDLGKSGEMLLEFAEIKLADYEAKEAKKAEEAERREAKKAEMRKAEKEEEERREAKRLEEAADRSAREHARSMEKLKCETEANIAKAELLKAQAMSKPASSASDGSSSSHNVMLKIPKFAETDYSEPHSYLHRFETVARLNGLEKKHWSKYLLPLLTGPALQAALDPTLAPEVIEDYDKVKEVILKKFQLTADGYRRRFSSMLPAADPAIFKNFLSEVVLSFNSWITLSKINKDFKELSDLILMNKVLNSVHPKIAGFILENKPQTFESLSELCINYLDAHKDAQVSIKEASPFPVASVDVQRGRSQSRKVRDEPRQPEQPPRQEARPRQEFKPNKNFHPHRDRSRGNSQTRVFEQRSKSEPRRPHASAGRTDLQQDRVSGYQGRNFQSRGTGRGPIRCYRCNGMNHLARVCPTNINSANSVKFIKEKRVGRHSRQSCCRHRCDDCIDSHGIRREDCVHTVPIISATASIGHLSFDQGMVNGNRVSVLRDSGSSIVGIAAKLVTDGMYTGSTVFCRTFSGRIEEFPLAKVWIDSPYYVGEVVGAVLHAPVADLILGNIPGIKNISEEDIYIWEREHPVLGNAVQTRAGRRREITEEQNGSPVIESTKQKMTVEPIEMSPVETPPVELSLVSTNETEPKDEQRTSVNSFIKKQRCDPSLTKLFSLAEDQGSTKLKAHYFKLHKGVLYRCYFKHNIEQKQIVLPQVDRPMILKLAHDSPFAGHLATSKTSKRILTTWYWPGCYKEIRDYCRSCKICQESTPKGKCPKAPLQVRELADRPFSTVCADLTGPYVTSNRGYRYILSIVCCCTRYPESIPLKNVTTETVTEALLGVFSRIGLPEKFVSDRGGQFIAESLHTVMKMLGVKQVFSAAWSPQGNGIAEAYQKALKSMLGRVTTEHPKDWDLYVPAVLFAFREIPHESTGFSPFELIYGANPRGLMSVAKDLVVGKEVPEETRSAYEHVVKLRQIIVKSVSLAIENSDRASARQREYVNKFRTLRKYLPGDKVFLLRPTKANRLSIQWQGPFDIVRRVTAVDYVIRMGEKEKVYHYNMLKPFFVRPSHLDAVTEQLETRQADVHDVNIACITDGEEEMTNDNKWLTITTPEVRQNECWKDVTIAEDLSDAQRRQVASLLQTHQSVLTDIPGCTNLVVHDIVLTDHKPVRVRPYVVPLHYRQKVEEQIKELLQMGIIEESDSPYAFPMVVVKKKDGSLRICIDYKKLNSITVADPVPMPNAELLLTQLATARFFTKLDLAKGYYQIPLAERAKPFTAFRGLTGHYQWNYLPFGLVNSPATFVRMMNKALGDRSDCITYIDDICLFHKTWEEHMTGLDTLLQTLDMHGLTVRPTKMEVGARQIQFLGHQIGHGELRPDERLVGKIRLLSVPKTRKEVRAIIGLINYYSKFIPNFASLTCVLSELIKKSAPNKIIWTPECDQALERIKCFFDCEPILKLPLLSKPFVLCTDASAFGLGAVLMQEHGELLHPVMYISRKLTPPERNYATIEREALAIIWAVGRLANYLLGTTFTLLTDHKPLTFLNSGKTKNARLLRWSLVLQDFKFITRPIAGEKNILADMLSRC